MQPVRNGQRHAAVSCGNGGHGVASVGAPRSPACFVVSPTLAVTGVAALAGLIYNLLDQQRRPSMEDEGVPCPTCEGTGFVPCMCTRWSGAGAKTRQQGCEKCAGSKKERCPRCGGGGLLSPTFIPQRVPVESNLNSQRSRLRFDSGRISAPRPRARSHPSPA